MKIIDLFFQDVLTDGILTGEITLLSIYFTQLNPSRHLSQELNQLVEFGLKRALTFLYDREILLAAQILKNLVCIF